MDLQTNDILTAEVGRRIFDAVLTLDEDALRAEFARARDEHGIDALVADVLVPGGTWRLATDWADYAWHMRDVVEASPRFTNPWTGRLADAGDAHVDPEGARGGFAPRFEGRTTTRFETKGLKVERIVRDLEVKRAN